MPLRCSAEFLLISPHNWQVYSGLNRSTLKRIALVTIFCLSSGLFTTIAPAKAQISQSLAVAVGPNNETSLTVVSGGTTTETVTALIRIDVTSNDTNALGLAANETITGSITAVPTAISAKTIGANGGTMSDTSTYTSGKSDLIMIETTGQTAGTPGTASTAIYKATNWNATANITGATGLSRMDSAAAGSTAAAVDGKIGSTNSKFVNMDSNQGLAASNYVTSYYVTIINRPGATVIDQGAYTLQFQLTDENGNVRSTKTIKLDFVSSTSKADGVLTLTKSGNFFKGTTYYPYDTATGAPVPGALKLTLKNRDGGLIRNSKDDNAASNPSPLVVIQRSTSANPVFTDSGTSLSIADNGTYGQDWGSDKDNNGAGSLRQGDGVYGVIVPTPTDITSTAAGELNSYQFVAKYGNATIITLAFTVEDTEATGTIPAVTKTDVLVNATGLSASDQAQKNNLGTTVTTWTLPITSNKGGSIQLTIQDASGVVVPDASMTVTSSWSGPFGSALFRFSKKKKTIVRAHSIPSNFINFRVL